MLYLNRNFSADGTMRAFTDLSDNTCRAQVLERLIETASCGSPSNIITWSPPQHMECPEEKSTHNTGALWKLCNQLKVMAQYQEFLRGAASTNLFLKGSKTTCVQELGWFTALALPMQALSSQKALKTHEYLAACAQNLGISSAMANFEVHRSVQHVGLSFTQVLLEQHFPGPFKEYELNVCKLVLKDADLTYESWQKTFQQWRLKGAYYPMLLAASAMPYLDDWLPEAVHGSDLGVAWQNTLEVLRRPTSQATHADCLESLAVVWNADRTGASEVLGSILDRLCILMGVKSNDVPGTGDFCLATRLHEYSTRNRNMNHDPHALNHCNWQMCKGEIEATFPPSLLCASLVKPKRDTWGYPRLSLAVARKPQLVVHFAERKLQVINAAALQASTSHTYSPPFIKECLLHQTSQRVQDVLWRLGEIVLDPYVFSCMVEPGNIMKHFGLGCEPSEDDFAETPKEQVIQHLQRCESGLAEPDVPYTVLTHHFEELVPKIVTMFYPIPQRVLMWRVDLPAQTVLYVGDNPSEIEAHAWSHEKWPKVLVNTKMPQGHTGGIVVAPLCSTESFAQDCLKHFARTKLADHPANLVLVNLKDVQCPVTCTTLAETVCCFAMTRSPSVSLMNLGGSVAWKESGIDPRYAEKQIGLNGFRFRDWTAMHSGRSTQQSRLACHAVTFDCLYTTMLPWVQEDQGVTWVNMTSTLEPSKIITIHGSTLQHAVEKRFMHDLKMLPTHQGQRIDRGNCELYTDEEGSVAIAYSTAHDNTAHFVHFCLLKK